MINASDNFKFRISISREGYQDKQTAKMCLSSFTSKQIGKEKMAFMERYVSIDEFIDYAIHGHSFCNLFSFNDKLQYWIKSGKGHYTKTYPVYKRGNNKGYFKLSFKSDEFFAGSQTVFVDIDYTHFNSIEEYINCLTYKPTAAYYSYSDLVEKQGIISRRFRLVYIFDSVLSADQFKNITFVLYDTIVKDTQEEMYDSCGCSYSQYMNGSNSKEYIKTNIIYSASDFTNFDFNTITLPEEEKPAESKFEISKELLNDITYLPYERVIRKYFDKGFRYITKTDLDFEGRYYTTTTDDYVSLMYMPEKLTDGNQRRKKLYLRASLRRLAKQDITPDELLYNLIIDVYKFFDNSDGAITTEVLVNKVKAAFSTSMEDIKAMNAAYSHPNFVINPEVKDKHAAIAEARKEMTDEKIGYMYDINLSVRANQAAMKEFGYNVSVSRLYKWCSTNNIQPIKSKTRKTEVKTGYNPLLSIRENMKVMNCTMHQVLKAKKAACA